MTAIAAVAITVRASIAHVVASYIAAPASGQAKVCLVRVAFYFAWLWRPTKISTKASVKARSGKNIKISCVASPVVTRKVDRV